MGTRMGGNFPKVLYELGDGRLIDYVVDTTEKLDPEAVVVVVGFGKELVMAHLGDRDLRFAEQIYQLGTADAVHAGLSAFENESDGTVIVLSGDVPLIPEETLRDLVDYHEKNKMAATVLSVFLDDATGYGRIVRDDAGNLDRIVEHKDASERELAISEINSGTYAFDLRALRDNIDKIDKGNKQGEYYLTDIIAILKDMGMPVGAHVFKGEPMLLSGVNRPEHLSQLEGYLKNRS